MYRIIFIIFIGLLANPVLASEKAGIRPGFEHAQIEGQKIILFRPIIRVGEQSTSGLFEPRAEWSDKARVLMDAELKLAQLRLANQVINMTSLKGENARKLEEYQALFRLVARSAVDYQFFRGNRLPTLKRGDFDWSLGEGARELADLSGARYGLFIYTEDHYGSAGRKLLQIVSAGFLGSGVRSGVHKGYAGLVDLHSGDVLWLNADTRMGGDVREPEGMAKRVRQLLEDFPGITAGEGA